MPVAQPTVVPLAVAFNTVPAELVVPDVSTSAPAQLSFEGTAVYETQMLNPQSAEVPPVAVPVVNTRK